MAAVTIEEAIRTRCALHPFDGSRSCITTGCMAWRWYYFTQAHIEHGPEHDPGEDSGGPARGYCGHAGALT